MLIGVDGTGAWGDVQYKKEMQNSFVSQILRGSPVPKKVYFRGPEGAGLLKITSPQGLAWGIESLYEKGDKTVFLTGYSRGAATVINAAALLKGKVPVEALFLFDAVDRSVLLDAETIPNNVKHCYHAIRSTDARSRQSFGNCGLIAELGVSVVTNRFFTTHGGMGGTPWGEAGLLKPPPGPAFSPFDDPTWPGPIGPTTAPIMTPQQVAEAMVRKFPERFADKIYEGAPDWDFTNVTPEQEKLGMDKVKNWMWPHLRKHGVVV
jgi:hypothetical protein